MTSAAPPRAGTGSTPARSPAYLAAYASHPQLPPRCLADLIRQDPAAPGTLTLSGAREIAARHDLDVRIRRCGGQAYITFREPGIGGPPVLSYPAGTGSARHGPCEVPVAAIDSYLLTYRASVPPAMFAAPVAGPQDWARRVSPAHPAPGRRRRLLHRRYPRSPARSAGRRPQRGHRGGRQAPRPGRGPDAAADARPGTRSRPPRRHRPARRPLRLRRRPGWSHGQGHAPAAGCQRPRMGLGPLLYLRPPGGP